MSKNGRRNDVTTEIVVGAFMFTILVVLLTITVVISQNKLFEKSWNLRAVFPSVGGLKEGENVFLRGVKVGNVDLIEVSEDADGVVVDMILTRPVDLYEDYALNVESSSLLGGMRLVIDAGSKEKGLIPEEEHQNLVGQPAPDLIGAANDLITDLTKLTQDIRTGDGSVAKLIRDETLYDESTQLVSSLNKSASNLVEISEDVKQVTNRLSAGKGTLGRLLSEDDSLYKDLSETVTSLKTASEDVQNIVKRVSEGQGTLGKLLSPDDELYQDLRKTVASLEKFSSELGQQEGTVGRLIQDDTLYIKMEGLIDEARATIDDFRETSPITTFSSIFFGAF